jgi:hypothetical protein
VAAPNLNLLDGGDQHPEGVTTCPHCGETVLIRLTEHHDEPSHFNVKQIRSGPWELMENGRMRRKGTGPREGYQLHAITCPHWKEKP